MWAFRIWILCRSMRIYFKLPRSAQRIILQCNQHKKTSKNRTSPNNGQTTDKTKSHKKQLRQRRNYYVCGVMFGAADRTWIVELIISNSRKLLANAYSTRLYIILRKLVFAVFEVTFCSIKDQIKTKINDVSLHYSITFLKAEII